MERGDARCEGEVAPWSLWSCMHCGWITRGRHVRAWCVVRGACNACGGRVGWYAETHPLRTVAIPTIARDERGDGRVSEREREHTIQPWPSQTTRSRPAPVHHPPSSAQRIIRHPEEGPSIQGAEWVTDAVPSHPHPIRSCRSKPIMPVSMRAPDGRGFVRERVRRVSGEDILGAW